MSKRLLLFLILATILCGCKQTDKETFEMGLTGEQTGSGGQENVPEQQPATGIAYETAEDAAIDFKALQIENPDIFGEGKEVILRVVSSLAL